MNKFFFLFFFYFAVIPVLNVISVESAEDAPLSEDPTAPDDLKDEKIPLKTDDDVINREHTVAEKFQFKADVNRVMEIIINSIYSKKEIFLRELISNASDAIDKIRYISLTNPEALGEGDSSKLEISIKADPDHNTLTIRDTGIGMTRDDLIKKLGTIAKSGTKEFLEAVNQADMNLIGQFGVGFYSSFLVAERVLVRSKNNNDGKQWIWESSVSESFSVYEDPDGNTLGRGTSITLFLKEEADDFLKEDVLRALIKKYSEFINFPIYLWHTEEVSEEVPDETQQEEVYLDTETEAEAEAGLGTRTKTVTKKVHSWELQNDNKPLWTRNPKEITEDDYNNFYKSFTKDPKNPLTYTHFIGEGEIEFKSILYIPWEAPDSVSENENHQRGMRLYVKRVFITDNFQDMFPRYLAFVQGVVDSDNLPLNVSREVLQQDRTLSLIKKKLTRKVIAMIQNLAEDKEKFDQFYEQYGTNLKYGVSGDPANRHRLSKLLRFNSSKTKTLTSLDDYVGRMKEGQTQVLYVAGESKEVLARSPFVEKLIRRGYEVLFMTDPIDEWAVQNLGRFDNKWVLTDVAKEGFKLEGAAEEEEAVREEEFQPLVDYLQEKLAGRIGKVVISSNLYRAPSAISSGAMGFTANMERLMKAQAFTNPQTLNQYKSTRILEINPKHSIILELNRRIQDPSLSSSPDEALLSNDIAELLYDSASLQSGFTVEDSASFGSRIFKLMKLSLDLSLEDEFEDEEEVEFDIHEGHPPPVEEEAEAAPPDDDSSSFSSSQESSASAKDEL